MATLASTKQVDNGRLEELTFVDAFGKVVCVYLQPMTQKVRASQIVSVLRSMTADEERIMALAAANGDDLTANLATGAAALEALRNALVQPL